jgi:hypothetical protein
MSYRFPTARVMRATWGAVLLLSLLHASGARAQLRMGHFSTRDVPASPYLEDFRADFSFDYPLDWSLRSPVEGTEMIVMAGKGAPPAVEGTINVSPLHVSPKASPALAMALAKVRAAEFEAMAYRAAVSYRKTFEGETVFNGMPAYEIHNSGARVEDGASRMLGRLIFIPPTDTTAGVMIVLAATAGSNGINEPADLGRKGDLARVAESFRLRAERKPGDSIRTFVNRREKTHPRMLDTYVDFSFPYRRSWELETSIMNMGIFASVRTGVERGGIPNFSTDHFTVGSYDLGVKPGTPASAVWSLKRLAAEVEKSVSAEFSTYTKASEGPVAMGGVEGYEIRYAGTLPSPNAKGVAYYGRLVALPSPIPGRGVIITMIATSLSPGVKGPADVGEKGELGEVVRGFVMGRGR